MKPVVSRLNRLKLAVWRNFLLSIFQLLFVRRLKLYYFYTFILEISFFFVNIFFYFKINRFAWGNWQVKIRMSLRFRSGISSGKRHSPEIRYSSWHKFPFIINEVLQTRKRNAVSGRKVIAKCLLCVILMSWLAWFIIIFLRGLRLAFIWIIQW